MIMNQQAEAGAEMQQTPQPTLVGQSRFLAAGVAEELEMELPVIQREAQEDITPAAGVVDIKELEVQADLVGAVGAAAIFFPDRSAAEWADMERAVAVEEKSAGLAGHRYLAAVQEVLEQVALQETEVEEQLLAVVYSSTTMPF
jgi:hypothetical protein